MITTNERILFMINHFCEGNKAEFARMMGEKPQTINGWLNRNNGNGVLAKILNKFPMVNPAWLYTGKGEMIDEHSNERVKDAMAKEVNPYVPTEVKPKTIVGKVGAELGESVAGMTVGSNIAMAAAPSFGFGGIIGALFGILFDSKEDITEEEAVDVLKEALEDAKKTTQENEELKQEVEYWRQKANNLEYQLSKTKAG